MAIFNKILRGSDELFDPLDGHKKHLKIFASLDSQLIDLMSFHTFGYPCYIFDARLQTGQDKMLKWDPCARMGIYVERFPTHAVNVGHILNPCTGHILQQFHMV